MLGKTKIIVIAIIIAAVGTGFAGGKLLLDKNTESDVPGDMGMCSETTQESIWKMTREALWQWITYRPKKVLIVRIVRAMLEDVLSSQPAGQIRNVSRYSVPIIIVDIRRRLKWKMIVSRYSVPIIIVDIRRRLKWKMIMNMMKRRMICGVKL